MWRSIMRAPPRGMGWTQQTCIAIALINGLCGISLADPDTGRYISIRQATIGRAPGRMMFAGMRPINTHTYDTSVWVRQDDLPNAVQVNIWELELSRLSFVSYLTLDL